MVYRLKLEKNHYMTPPVHAFMSNTDLYADIVDIGGIYGLLAESAHTSILLNCSISTCSTVEFDDIVDIVAGSAHRSILHNFY